MKLSNIILKNDCIDEEQYALNINLHERIPLTLPNGKSVELWLCALELNSQKGYGVFLIPAHYSAKIIPPKPTFVRRSIATTTKADGLSKDAIRILPLSHQLCYDQQLAGGKGANLALLHSLQLHVSDKRFLLEIIILFIVCSFWFRLVSSLRPRRMRKRGVEILYYAIELRSSLPRMQRLMRIA